MDGSAFLWYIEVKDTAKKRRKWNMGQKEIEALIAAGGDLRRPDAEGGWLHMAWGIFQRQVL